MLKTLVCARTSMAVIDPLQTLEPSGIYPANEFRRRSKAHASAKGDTPTPREWLRREIGWSRTRHISPHRDRTLARGSATFGGFQ